MFAAALLQDNPALALATLPLAGALLGFLCFNFNPATIFLGDGGSLLIGFLLGCYGAVWSQKSVTLLGMTAPLIALSIPLIDVLLCVIRRFLRNRPIFSADRGHIHHRLIDRGLTPRRAVLAIYCVCGLAAAVSLLQSYLPNVYVAALAIVVFVGVIWTAVRFLGYAEFVLAGRILRTGGFQRLVTAQLELEDFRKSLGAAKNIEQCWRVLSDWCRPLGFDKVTLYLGTQTYQSSADVIAEAWSLSIPVAAGIRVDFLKNQATGGAPVIVTSLVEILRNTLPSVLERGGVSVDDPLGSAAVSTRG
jgi:UDP-GlcNAc:undecaprenyl-phosphate GlcNAc-1-phosphate transferase